MRLIASRLELRRDFAHGHTVARLGSAIHLHGVTHWYRSGRSRVEALHDVELEIPAGGYVALTGPSGAGKSMDGGDVFPLPDSPYAGMIVVASSLDDVHAVRQMITGL